MKKLTKSTGNFFLLLLGLTSSALAAAPLPLPSILKNSQQLVLVVTNSWNSYEGTMQLFDRHSADQPWKPASQSWPVVVGKQGIAWEDQYNSQDRVLPGPVKHEGDKKSIAGAFGIGPAFGFAAKADQNLRLNYIPITSSIECVDDSNSQYYGKIVDNTKVNKDWHSSEIMINYPAQYTRGFVVDYNTNGKMINGGSCIFLHIKGPSDADGTTGCTAMSPENLSAIWNSDQTAAEACIGTASSRSL